MRQRCSRIILVVILVSLASLLFGSIGEGAKQPDGYWWNDEREDVKFFYVYGVVVGTTSAVARLAMLQNEEYRELVTSDVLKDCPEKYIKAIISFVKEKQLLEPFSIPEILDGMNEFYKDFRNRRIAIDEAIDIVRMHLKEEPPLVIEKIIQMLRERSRNEK